MVCDHCKRTDVQTSAWVGDGGTLAYIHGMHSQWCDLCQRTAQLEYAKARAADIPQLEADVARLTAERDAR